MSNSNSVPTSSSDLLERFGVEGVAGKGRSGDDHLGPVLSVRGTHVIHVDAVLGAGAVRHG